MRTKNVTSVTSPSVTGVRMDTASLVDIYMYIFIILSALWCENGRMNSCDTVPQKADTRNDSFKLCKHYNKRHFQ